MSARILSSTIAICMLLTVISAASIGSAKNNVGGPRSSLNVDAQTLNVDSSSGSGRNERQAPYEEDSVEDSDEDDEGDDAERQHLHALQQQQQLEESSEDSDEDGGAGDDFDDDNDARRRKRRDTGAVETQEKDTQSQPQTIAAVVAESHKVEETSQNVAAGTVETLESNVPAAEAANPAEPEKEAVTTVAPPSRKNSVLLLIVDALKKVTSGLPSEQVVATNTLQYFQLFEKFLQQAIEEVIGDDDDDEEAVTIKTDIEEEEQTGVLAATAALANATPDVTKPTVAAAAVVGQQSNEQANNFNVVNVENTAAESLKEPLVEPAISIPLIEKLAKVTAAAAGAIIESVKPAVISTPLVVEKVPEPTIAAPAAVPVVVTNDTV